MEPTPCDCEIFKPLKFGDTVHVYEIAAGTGGSVEPSTISIYRRRDGPFTGIGPGADQFEDTLSETVD